MTKKVTSRSPSPVVFDEFGDIVNPSSKRKIKLGSSFNKKAIQKRKMRNRLKRKRIRQQRRLKR